MKLEQMLDLEQIVRDETRRALRELGILPKETRLPMPRPGETFTVADVEFVAIGAEQRGLLAVTKEPIGEYPFDEDGCNDWSQSSIRRFLNEEWVKKFDKAMLLPFSSDLTADDGMTDYGTCEDYAFLLSDALHRKYRAVLPKYDCWWWHLTPWACSPSVASYVRFSIPSGALSYSNARSARGAVSGLLFNPSIFDRAESECDSIAKAETEQA